MATLIADLGVGNVKLRYKEEFVSEGVNEKLWGVLRRGIMRGFDIAPAGGLTVSLEVNPDVSDSLAVIEDSTGRQFRVRLTGSSGVADLAAYAAGDVVVLVLEVVYAVGGATEFRLDAHLEAAYNALPDREFKCVVGEVTIPVGGVIASADISYRYRSYATVGSPLGSTDYPRGGLPRAALAGPTSSCENLRVENWSDASVGAVVSQAVPEPVFAPEQTDSQNVFHFELTETAVEKYAAFMFPLVSKVPVRPGQRVYLESMFRLENVDWKAAWGGDSAIRFRAVFYSETATIETQDLELTPYVAGPPYSTVGYLKASTTFVAPATAVFASVQFECLGVKKAVAVAGSSYIRLANADCWFEPRDAARGDAGTGGLQEMNGRGIFLSPEIDLPGLKEFYDAVSGAFPYSDDKSLPPVAMYARADIAELPDIPGTAVYVVPTRTPGKARFAVIMPNGVDLFNSTTGSNIGVGSPYYSGARMSSQGVYASLVQTTGSGAAMVQTTGAGDAVVKATGTGKVTIRNQGTGGTEVKSDSGAVDVSGNIVGEAGGTYKGAKIEGASCATVMRLKETNGVPAAGAVVKRIEDLLACAPAEDIEYEEWLYCEMALTGAGGSYRFFVKFPYAYIKGTTPMSPANWYSPAVGEVSDTLVPDMGVYVVSGVVESVTKFGFTYRLDVTNPVQGDLVKALLKWKLVPTP